LILLVKNIHNCDYNKIITKIKLNLKKIYLIIENYTDDINSYKNNLKNWIMDAKNPNAE
jgi:hypothetical protein